MLAFAERCAVFEGKDSPQAQCPVDIAREPPTPVRGDVIQKLHARGLAGLPATRNRDFLHPAVFEPQRRDHREDQE